MYIEFIKCDRDEVLFKIDFGKNWNGFLVCFVLCK